ncbi:class I SAM-dependent methyltransferase [Belnapia moabensis]|uniref:class I SAM-dependent methyltransferase n=1 Tax=Belnapia moabensis TaxID=365533 RepID=UPI000694B52D|nr:methyltransferase domain-containing protein [Belnapia moabensis]
MREGLTFTNEAAAAGYEGAFAHVSSHFVPFLLRAAQVAPGMRVLDIAAGTGLVTSAAAEAVGSSGHVTAADISAAMVGKARERLGNLSNVLFAVEDGQAMGFPNQNFEAVLCGLGLMFFPDAARALQSSIAS